MISGENSFASRFPLFSFPLSSLRVIKLRNIIIVPHASDIFLATHLLLSLSIILTYQKGWQMDKFSPPVHPSYWIKLFACALCDVIKLKLWLNFCVLGISLWAKASEKRGIWCFQWQINWYIISYDPSTSNTMIGKIFSPSDASFIMRNNKMLMEIFLEERVDKNLVW